MGYGLALLGASLGAGLVLLGAATGIGKLAGSAVEGIARQPEASGKIQTAMLIAAALIEGVAFFALVICMGMGSNTVDLAKIVEGGAATEQH